MNAKTYTVTFSGPPTEKHLRLLAKLWAAGIRQRAAETPGAADGSHQPLGRKAEGEALGAAKQERLLRMCDLAHKMGRGALGTEEASE